jgi:hypothetical protein
MASKNRIFISFAIEDRNFRDLLVGQARNAKSPFELVDMSVKQPWDEKWKTNCRTRIKGCDGVIALISKNTAGADGALWEIACAQDEGVPIRGVHCTTDNRPSSTPSGLRMLNWTWENISNFINSL